MNWVARTAAALIAVQLVIRAVLAFSGYFYWDDLILVGRAGTQGLFSPGYLFDDHDGHVMPAAFLVAGVITRLAPLNWIGPGHQPGRAATAGVAGAAARTARDPRLAARAAGAVDVRALHATGCAGVRVVGRGVELAADARRDGVGVRRRHPAGAHRQSALRASPGLLVYLRRPAVLREVGGHSVRRVHDHRAAGPRHRSGLTDDGVAPRDPVVGGVTGADGRLDRGVPRGRRSEAVEPRLVDDVGPVEPLDHSRHRAGSGWRAVGLAALGAGLAVGHSAGDGDGARLGRAGGRRRGDPPPQATHRLRCGWSPWATRWPVRFRST